MATDIAFAVGILTILGNRVPAALRVLLLAVAVIDDLGAIIVIALFYSSGISFSGLLVAAAAFGGILVMQRLGIRSKVLYVIPGAIAWAGVYAAGIHPTIAGVLLGLMTPVVPWLGPDGFLASIKGDLEALESGGKGTVGSTEVAAALRHVNFARRETLAPADSLIEDLHSWVAFFIMPVFALANAGVSLSGAVFDSQAISVATAVAVGLLVGKPLGILLFSGAMLKLRLATLPLGLTYRHLFVLSAVAGVGFTMALFIAQLAFNDPTYLAAAKLGILGASGGAALLTLIFGRFFLQEANHPARAMSADEAEASTEK
jgi:NhaA family Na+:H+ antiporter